MSRQIYNINGTVSNLKVGETDNTKTPYATFTLIHDAPGKDGQAKKTLVDAYGAAALKVLDGGFAEDGKKIRVGGVYKDEERTNKDTGAKFKLPILHLLHCETPKTAEELAALKAAKQAKLAANDTANDQAELPVAA
jgi:hypothetical protein